MGFLVEEKETVEMVWESSRGCRLGAVLQREKPKVGVTVTIEKRCVLRDTCLSMEGVGEAWEPRTSAQSLC
jgi:hypothetical protein